MELNNAAATSSQFLAIIFHSIASAAAALVVHIFPDYLPNWKEERAGGGSVQHMANVDISNLASTAALSSV